MAKRTMIFGSYDTALTGLWTLTGWEFSPAEYQANLVEVPGRRKGPLDLSTTLTDGEPIYSSRTLTVTLESSEGTRMERESRIQTMVNWLDGWKMNIILPDDAAHYIVGRVHVQKEYNDLAHAAVTVTAICEPWRYNNNETVIALAATAEEQVARLSNDGRMTVVPLLTVADGTVSLKFGTASWALSAGTYQLPDLILAQGGADITYSGTGTLTFSYREALL